MSAEKHQQLIDSGALWADGSRKEVCPTCGRELPPGEHLPAPSGAGDAVAEAESVVAGTEVPS